MTLILVTTPPCHSLTTSDHRDDDYDHDPSGSRPRFDSDDHDFELRFSVSKTVLRPQASPDDESRFESSGPTLIVKECKTVSAGLAHSGRGPDSHLSRRAPGAP
jgi:hypothetical protein